MYNVSGRVFCVRAREFFLVVLVVLSSRYRANRLTGENTTVSFVARV